MKKDERRGERMRKVWGGEEGRGGRGRRERMGRKKGRRKRGRMGKGWRGEDTGGGKDEDFYEKKDVYLWYKVNLGLLQN